MIKLKIKKISIPKRTKLKSILKSGYSNMTRNVVNSVKSANKALKLSKIKYKKPNKEINKLSQMKPSKLKFKF